jgi:hypothetical protein
MAHADEVTSELEAFKSARGGCARQRGGGGSARQRRGGEEASASPHRQGLARGDGAFLYGFPRLKIQAVSPLIGPPHAPIEIDVNGLQLHRYVCMYTFSYVRCIVVV